MTFLGETEHFSGKNGALDFPPKRTRILRIPSKPDSVHSVHSAIGSRMNEIRSELSRS